MLKKPAEYGKFFEIMPEPIVATGRHTSPAGTGDTA
jgi:hypothetical protein